MDDKHKIEEDDFLDFSEIKEEIKDGPSEEEFTKAIDAMSETDRDIFEDTGIIHIDRDMPAETQAMHVIHLQKQNEKRKNKIISVIVVFMLLGLGITFAGIYLKNTKDTTPKRLMDSTVEEDETLLAINETTFPDTIFRSYVLKNFDTNGDGSLSAEERNSVIAIIAPEDSSLTSLQGIENFPLLQSLTFLNTGVTEVNLTSNKKLTFVDCSSSPVTNIQLPEDTKLSCELTQEGTYTTCKINE